MRTYVREAVELRTEALELTAQGINDCEISRRLGVPRTTVRDWRKPRYVPRRPRRAPSRRPRCRLPATRVEFDAGDYAELLGIYLSDGCINVGPRAERLRIFLDAAHPNVAAETEALLKRCFPANRVGRGSRHNGHMVVLWVYSGHLSCLFPQHGPGKKHQRRILLEPWQDELVAAAPWRFLGGCIRTDGCAFINRTGPHEYLSYDFCNLSRTSSTTSSARVAGSVFGHGERRTASASIGARTWPGWSSTSATNPDRRIATLRAPAAVVKLVYTRASGARELYARGGSSPLSRTPSLP